MSSSEATQEIITIAFGADKYHEQAQAFARSFRLHNPGWSGLFTIATDRVGGYPKDLDWVHYVPTTPGIASEGFAAKLRFGELSTREHVLYVDSDSIWYGRVEPIFAALEGRAFAVTGRMLTEGYWYAPVPAMCARFGVPALPRFNGGLYYLERSRGGQAVIERSFKLFDRYDEIGWKRIGPNRNDEVCVSAAMAEQGLAAYEEDGTMSVNLLDAPQVVALDVFSGHADIRPTGPRDQRFFQIDQPKPAIVHFAAQSFSLPPYSREALKLKLHAEAGLPPVLARAVAYLMAQFPHDLRRLLPRRFRRSLRKSSS